MRFIFKADGRGYKRILKPVTDRGCQLKSELDLLLAENEEEATGEGKEDAEIVDEEPAEEIQIVLEDLVSSAVKSAVVGLLLGMFASCFIMTLFYMLGGKLQSTKNFKEEYGIPVLGFIHVLETKRKLFGFIDRWIYCLRAGVYSKIGFDEQIKMAIVNVQTAIDGIPTQKNMKKIMIAGTIPEKDTEFLYTRLTSEIHDISLSAYKQIVFHSMALRELDGYDAVIFLEKRGVSYSGMINQEKKLALDRNVNILGAIVLT